MPDQESPVPRPPGPPARKGGLLGRVRYGLPFLLDPMGVTGGRFQRFGDTYFVGSEDGSQPGLYVFRHPDALHEVLVEKARSFDKGHSAFEAMSQVLGEGLLNTDGDVWRRQRRLVQPAFRKERLEEYTVAMVDEAEIEARRFRDRDGEEVDVADAMMEMTLRIVCRTLFGYDAAGEENVARNAMNGLQLALTGLSVPLPPLISPAARRVRRAKASLDELIYRLIDARQPGEPHDDLLQRLVDAEDEDGSRLTRREIRDQLVTLYLAGHETTSNALTWTFHLLSQNPEVEATLFDHLADVLGGRSPTAADLPQLTYTDWVFTEAMRLYPPVYAVSRKAVADVEVGGYLVPAGSEIVLWIWHTHRDPRWWPEPWAFRPERHAPDLAATRPRLAYLPFGAGARACIGKVFAQWEGVLALATLAQRVRFEATQPAVDLRARITLSPKGGLRMRAVVR